MLSTALFLTAAIATTDVKGVGSLLQNRWERLDVPGKGEPEYTDEEAAAFCERLAELNADRERKSGTLEGTLEALKMDPKKLRFGSMHYGNATDWVEYRISPGYDLSAAYTQGAAKETAFRGVRIIKVERVKDK
jgi:hypothetical protein